MINGKNSQKSKIKSKITIYSDEAVLRNASANGILEQAEQVQLF